MESVTIIAAHDYEALLKARIPTSCTTSTGALARTVIERGDARSYLSRDTFIEQELEPQAIEAIRRRFSSPVFYVLDFVDIGLCRDLVLALADDPELLVDNDHGVLLPGPEFAALLRSRPEWDWRYGDEPPNP